MTKTDITYIPNILPLNQESSSKKSSNNHLKKVFYPFFFKIYLLERRCFSYKNIYPHLDEYVYSFD